MYINKYFFDIFFNTKNINISKIKIPIAAPTTPQILEQIHVIKTLIIETKIPVVVKG